MVKEETEQQCLALITKASELRGQASKCHCKTMRLKLEEEAELLEKSAEKLMEGDNNE